MNKADIYFTIEKENKAIFKAKGSKFIALAFPVGTEEEVKNRLTLVKKKYHDARHHCYAYRLGAEEPYQYRINDDGEPSGTAGKPIFGQIISHKLTNLLVVVVRYFGGTLLGTGGLIRAYKESARDCLENVEIQERINYKLLKIRFPYEKTNLVMRLIKDEMLGILEHSAEYESQMSINIPKTQFFRVKDRFLRLEKIQIIEE